MNKITTVIFTFCFSVFAVNAQNQAVTVPAELKPFVEKGTKPIAVESADLNGDNLKDYVLVLHRENPSENDEEDYPEFQRPLLVLVRGKDNKLTLAKRNEKMVMCSLCGGVWGDPFAGITVGKNTFTVNHYGGSAWRWTADYKFNYSRIDDTWQLVRIEKTSYHNVRPMKETLEKTVLTPPKDFGKVDIADFDPEDYEEKVDDGTSVSVEESNLITPNSVWNVKIGMTVAEVRKAVSPMILKRTSDGEGIALIEVLNGEESVMTFYAGEEDPKAAINEGATVEQIETSNANFKTETGVSPGMSLADVEKQYGKVARISFSEIESREFVEFANQPKGLIFRFRRRDENTGKDPPRIRTTDNYLPNAFVSSIQVVGNHGSPKVIKISSDTGIGIGEGFLKNKGDRSEYVVNAKARDRMRVSIIDVETPDEEGPVMVGYVTSPNGAEEGNPGGLFFDQVLEETGDYKIVIKQNEAKSGSTNIEFKVKVTLEKGKDAFQNLDVKVFNDKIAKAAAANESWVKEPFLVLASITGPFSEMRSRKVEMVSPFADVTESLTVTVIDDGYADDSVRGEKFIFELKLEESGVWTVVSAKKAQVCWQNRGHQDYSTAPCL